MLIKKSPGEKIFDIINVILLSLLIVICLYPFLFVLISSISDPKLLLNHRGILLRPIGFTLKGYEMVFKNPNIWYSYKNTIFYVIVGTTLNILMTSSAAYVLSRKNFMFGTIIMKLITFTMFFGGGLIPFYLLVKNIGLLNTRLAIIIPYAVSVWNIIIMRTSFMGIPPSLVESAKIDGANDITILFRIILPVSKAILSVMTLFYAVGHWNSWFSAMIFLRDRSLFPLQLILREILISNDTSSMDTIKTLDSNQTFLYKELLKYCTVIVATVPILLIYPFLQKHFVKGVMIGSIKG